MLRRAMILVVLTWLLAATPTVAATRPSITVYAAASLKESLDAIVEAWRLQSGQSVRVSYAASSLLARQIDQGAPADLMISADTQWMDWLQTRDLIRPESRQDLLHNTLVLIAPTDSDLRPFELDCLPCWRAALDGRRLAIAEPDSVPAGRYAREALTELGVWSELSPRLALADNVRAALAYVALGELPLGIVYRTDAMAEPGVRVLSAIAPQLHARIIYPLAQLRGADATASADFLVFLNGVEARRIFSEAGFGVLAAAVSNVQR